MALPALIAQGINIAGYAGLLLGGHMILHGITNTSLRVDTSIPGYAGLLLGGHDITNNSLRVLVGGRTILHGIADCFRNQYRQVHRVTARWAHDFVWHS